VGNSRTRISAAWQSVLCTDKGARPFFSRAALVRRTNSASQSLDETAMTTGSVAVIGVSVAAGVGFGWLTGCCLTISGSISGSITC